MAFGCAGSRNSVPAYPSEPFTPGAGEGRVVEGHAAARPGQAPGQLLVDDDEDDEDDGGEAEAHHRDGAGGGDDQRDQRRRGNHGPGQGQPAVAFIEEPKLRATRFDADLVGGLRFLRHFASDPTVRTRDTGPRGGRSRRPPQ